MKKYLVAISREFGCGGIEISEKLASLLNIEYHNTDLIDKTLEACGIVGEKNEYDEIISSDQKLLWNRFGYGSTHHFLSDVAILKQKNVILEYANRDESCIFLGRCSNYYLKDYDNCLKFFLYAPPEFKINHIVNEYNLSNKDAEKMLKRIDRQRHNYYKYVTGTNRGNRMYNDVFINVAKYGIDGTVQIMKEIIHIWNDK